MKVSPVAVSVLVLLPQSVAAARGASSAAAAAAARLAWSWYVTTYGSKVTRRRGDDPRPSVPLKILNVILNKLFALIPIYIYICWMKCLTTTVER